MDGKKGENPKYYLTKNTKREKIVAKRSNLKDQCQKYQNGKTIVKTPENQIQKTNTKTSSTEAPITKTKNYICFRLLFIALHTKH